MFHEPTRDLPGRDALLRKQPSFTRRLKISEFRPAAIQY